MAGTFASDFIQTKENPCHNCQDRKLRCHASCEKYIEWKEEWDAARNAVHEYNDATKTSIAGRERVEKSIKINGLIYGQYKRRKK